MKTSILKQNDLERELDQLESLSVKLPDKRGVYDYLSFHLDMTDLIYPIASLLRQQFGPASQLSLEVYRDPEDNDEHLILYVRQPRYDKNIKKVLHRLYNKYSASLVGKSGWILVTTDYAPPK